MNDVCGEITVYFHKNGNWQDLADILLMNGYTLKISPENIGHISERNTATIKIVILKEEK